MRIAQEQQQHNVESTSKITHFPEVVLLIKKIIPIFDKPIW